jgi:hypothetical protein
MAGSLFVLPRVTPLNGSVGVPLSKLTFSRTGTSTAQNTYSDSALTTPNANPVVADANGVFGKIYLDAGTGFDYRVKWTTSADVLIWQEDDIKAGNTQSASYVLNDAAPFFDITETDASSNSKNWRLSANGEVLTLSAMNDAKSIITPIFTVSRIGAAVNVLNLLPTTLQLNNSTLLSAGSYTGSLTGLTTVPTVTVNYRQSGNHVILSFAAQQGTSNSTAFTITGMPAAIRPSSNVSGILCTIQDNATIQAGRVTVQSDGTLAFSVGLSSGTFTASSTKGTRDNCIAYPLL